MEFIGSLGGLKEAGRRLLGYDPVAVLHASSEEYLRENGTALHLLENVGEEALRRHVMDLNHGVSSATAESMDTWYQATFNRLRLNRFKIRLVETLRLLAAETDPNRRNSLLDAGAGTGILLKALGGGGTGVDLNVACAGAMRQEGLCACAASCESLPFRSKCFAYSCLFECLEHLESPLLALRELKRLTTEKIFLSIPYTPHTRVADFDVAAGKRPENYHVIEFSPLDFRRICARLGLRVLREVFVNPYSYRALPFHYRLLRRLRLFNRLQPDWVYYVLSPS
jgi:SAM-dependent methyltransferase